MRISDWSSDVALPILNLTHKCCLPRPSAKTVPRRLTTTPGCWPAIPLRSGLPHKELIHTKIRRFRNIHEQRSEESREGKECVSTCRSRLSPDHYKQTH